MSAAIRSIAACALLCGIATPALAQIDPGVARVWIEEMKQSPQGPFGGIGWFCVDGAVLGPRAGCSAHGGGIQHGTWSDRTRQLRASGYEIANILADLEPAQFTGPDADLALLRQIVLERFLMGWDQGWIFRGAFTYRGAFQIEDEEVGARRLVRALLGDPLWRDPSRFALLRETVRLLPIHVDTVSAAQVRADALSLAAADGAFMSLRAKIHNAPDAADADRVREFARERGRTNGRYEALADSIDRLYAPDGALAAVLKLAPIIAEPDVEKQLREKSEEFKDDVKPGRKLAAAARLLRLLRETFPQVEDPDVALEVLLTSLALEREVFAAGNVALGKIDGLTRRTRLWLLGYDADALYGIGLLSMRQLESVEKALIAIETRNPPLREYRDSVRYLARIPEWGGRALEFQLGKTIERWAALDPAARQYVPDRLRGSPMLNYGAVLDRVVADLNALAGIQHEIMGERVSAGVRALNPGLARGVVRALRDGQSALDLDPNGIYLLPETTPDLAPVAGILTRGEGSSLSHLQLLARNLGIPNVVIGESQLARVEKAIGARAVLAVSPGGVVQLAPDGTRWNAAFGGTREASTKVEIDVDPAKLDLGTTDFQSITKLRAWDSGRITGPKGANLGELRFAFDDTVPTGFVIPFGAFRRVLDQPLEPGGASTWNWMKERYAQIDRARGDEKKQLIAETLERLRSWIKQVDPGAGFEAQLRWNLDQHFGKDRGRRRLRAQRHQRRRPSGLHRRGSQPDDSERDRLRRHPPGDSRRLVVAVHRARLFLAPGAHEAAGVRVPGRRGAARIRVGEVGCARDRGRRERGPGVPHRRGERGCGRRGGWTGRRGLARGRRNRRNDALRAGRHARAYRARERWRSREEAGERRRRAARARRGQATRRVREERSGAIPVAAHRVGRPGAGRHRVRVPRRAACAAADPPVQRESPRAAQPVPRRPRRGFHRAW